MLRALLLALGFLSLLPLASMALAQGRKPPVPPGRDPGGMAIALLTTGVDYTLPQIAERLARDGEGELIGLDLADDDHRPFGEQRSTTPPHWGGDATRLALGILGGAAATRLVLVRVDPGNPASLARAVAFIAQTPARIVVVPMWGSSEAHWQPFGQAARHFAHLLFVVAAGDDGKNLDEQPVYPAAWRLPNVIVVTAARVDPAPPPGVRLTPTANWGADTVDAVALANDSVLAAGVAAKAAAIALSQAPASSGAELKLELIRSAPARRKGETPQRTRSLAIIVPSPATMRGRPRDRRGRILDKTRVPERLREDRRRDPRRRDGR